MDTDAKEVKIVTTENGKNGQNKCPKCGATDISLNVNNGKLRCNFCRFEFDAEQSSGFVAVDDLVGTVVGSGAKDIAVSTDDVVTFKCSSCGAEVVIDTNDSLSARCHWCRNVLSVQEQIPNGSVPDMVLPFAVKKEEAQEEIRNFVNKRKTYANPKFKEEFTTENIMGVYFPYMIVDINTHVKMQGEGEHTARRYTRHEGNETNVYYDVDIYRIRRSFDLLVDGLTIESSSDKLDKTNSDKTTNVINAIMPFDIENGVKWNANYLRGYSSEKRDTNIDNLKDLVETQTKDIARNAARNTIKPYDRGVAWHKEELDIKGQQWKSAYLPVWLYSYQEVKGEKKILHYVAVNARTKETMGSVPINMPKLLLVSGIIEFFGILLMFIVNSDNGWIFLSLGFIYFGIIYLLYRNKNARHMHEIETKRTVENMEATDEFIVQRKGVSNPRMVGANSTFNHEQSPTQYLAEQFNLLTKHNSNSDNKDEQD